MRIGVGRENWCGLPILWVVTMGRRKINVVWGNKTIRGGGTVFGWLAIIRIGCTYNKRRCVFWNDDFVREYVVGSIVG